MALYSYSKYKILIDPESKKTQGLQVGDVVRRQYFDNPNLIYSLMIVLETGSDIVREKESPYFIGALVEGDEPQQGELLDFVRVTNLFNSNRSGALYLTASDSESPYMDVIDGMATEHSLYLQEKPKRITAGKSFKFPVNGTVRNPERMVIAYKVRASKAQADVPLAFGYTDGSEEDGTDMVDISTDWQYKLSLITIDYPGQYPRQLTIAPELTGDDWCEISDLNIVRLSRIATFADSTKARIGKITGIIDPVFGLLEGYGAYFQNLYATRNVNIAGTLTAGDENGFASTFYVGKIHKNVIANSIGAQFSGGIVVQEVAPAGIGDVVCTGGDTELCVQSSAWRMERIGKRYTFSIWVKGTEGRIAFYQDEHYIQDVEIDIAGEWRRYKVSFVVQDSRQEAMYIRFKTSLTNLLLTAPQLESGNNASQYQPTDEHLSYVEDYGAWFNKGGIGGTIQNPLLRLNEDGSISSRNGSFIIKPDGTGYFAGGKFKWTLDDIELTDITIRWGELDDEAKDQILSQAKPSNIRAFVSSNLSTTQIYDKETRTWMPNWAHTNLILTPSLFISNYGDSDLIGQLADPATQRPGIKLGSASWNKNGKQIISGTDSCWIGDTTAKYNLTIKANHIGQHAPYMRYGFQAIWIDSSGNETTIAADIQFSQLTNPGARVMALAYAPDGNIFKNGESKNLTARCDLWRGAQIDSTNAEYRWGVRDESVFANVQMAAPVSKGSYTISLRSVANMVPGGVLYLICANKHIIQSIDELTKTVTLTTPLTRDYVTNSIVTTPLYDAQLGPGWAVLSETYPQGVIAGWRTYEITITPNAVRNFETFKCAIKDTDTTIGNSYAGQIVFDTITFTDMTDPFVVDIVGTKGFVIKNGENDIEAKALVYRSGKETDTTGTGFHYSWKLFDPEGIQVIHNYQGKQIQVPKTDIDTRGALVCEIYQGLNLIARGQISIVELYDGEDAYSVQIFTSDGNHFINGNISTTLTANVYKGAKEITETIPDNLFCWKRTSLNADGDAVWNEQHTGIGRHLTISDEDIFRRAMFTCEVTIN